MSDVTITNDELRNVSILRFREIYRRWPDGSDLDWARMWSCLTEKERELFRRQDAAAGGGRWDPGKEIVGVVAREVISQGRTQHFRQE